MRHCIAQMGDGTDHPSPSQYPKTALILMKKTLPPYTSRRRCTVAAVGILLAAPAVYAANDLWVGNTDANFGTLANWTGSLTPDGNTPEFGVAGTSGTALSNDISSASYAGLLFDSGASAYTVGGNAFTLTGNITNNSTNTQTINADITSTAARTVTATSGELVLGGNITSTIPSTNTQWSFIGTNKITLAGTNSFTASAAFAGLSFTSGSVDITGSTTSDGGSATNAGSAVIGTNASSMVTIASGGTLHIKGSTAGAANTTPNSILGHLSGSSTLNVGATDKSTSGTFTVDAGTGLLIGNSGGSGTLNVNSGTATINRGTVATTTTLTDTRLIMMGKDNVNSTGTINLNGGTLATDRQFVRDGSSATGAGTANFVFNGGTLKALANQTDWLQSTTATIAGQNIGAGTGTLNTNALALSSVTTTAVSTIDSNGFTVAINNNISGAGGFNIISSAGTGTVTFGGANTYTGATTVNSGTLALGASNRIADTSAMVLGGGTFATAGFSETLNTLTINTTSVIDFGSGTSALVFADSSAITWNGTLTLSNFDVGTDSLNFTSSTGLTGTQLSAISLSGYTATGLDANGFVTFTAVPEPNTCALAIIGSFGVMAAIRCRQRKV